MLANDMVEKKRLSEDEGVQLKPDTSPVDPLALYLRGLTVAGIEATGDYRSMVNIAGEDFAPDHLKGAHLHTLHITRLIYS